MTEKELLNYFDTLDKMEQAIGYRRENRKHLARIEKIKELLLEIYDAGSVPVEFEKETGIEECEAMVARNEGVKRVYERGAGVKASRALQPCGGGGRGVPSPQGGEITGEIRGRYLYT